VSNLEKLGTVTFSDHDMLVLTFTPTLAPTTGHGLWRMNTQLLDDPDFLVSLDTFLSTISLPLPSETQQQQWDRVKDDIKRFCVIAYIAKRKDQPTIIQDLNADRQATLHDYAHSSRQTKVSHTHDLEALELLLQQQTTEELESHALRSGSTWREQGEVSTGYFFRAIGERYQKRLVPPLHNPITNTITSTTEE
jgi:hypothetical protein